MDKIKSTKANAIEPMAIKCGDGKEKPNPKYSTIPAALKMMNSGTITLKISNPLFSSAIGASSLEADSFASAGFIEDIASSSVFVLTSSLGVSSARTSSLTGSGFGSGTDSTIGSSSLIGSSRAGLFS